MTKIHCDVIDCSQRNKESSLCSSEEVTIDKLQYCTTFQRDKNFNPRLEVSQ